MRRLMGVVLGAWVVGLAADRVNLADGVTPFVFTPFLAFTPILILSEWIRRRFAGSPVEISRSAIQYLITTVILLAAVWTSVSAAEAGSLSASRAALLSAELFGTWAVAVLVADRTDLLALLGRASVIALVLYLVADVLQTMALLGAVPTTIRLGTVTLSLQPLTYTAVIPRLTGLVADATRAGWALLVFGWFVALGERSPGVRRAALVLAAVMVVATLSRSALLAAAVSLALAVITRRRLQLRAGSLTAAAGLAAVLAIALFFVPTGSRRADAVVALDPLAGRFSASEASASEHLLLLERGLDEATSSPRRFALGLGYGGSNVVLQDVFPGNPYANFHSLYVTMLAESGIVALLCIVALLGLPLTRAGPWRPLVAGAAVVNLFYQTHAEPAFWLVLVLAWTVSEIPGRSRPRTG